MNGKSYSIAKLKDGLSSIIADVARGGEAVITDHNRPVARIVSLSRVPPLPRCDVERVLEGIPIRVAKKPKTSAAELVRRIRDEE